MKIEQYVQKHLFSPDAPKFRTDAMSAGNWRRLLQETIALARNAGMSHYWIAEQLAMSAVEVVKNRGENDVEKQGKS